MPNITAASALPAITIFRPGVATELDGKLGLLSPSDVAGLVASYDGVKEPAPMVIGQPKLDDPAYGWIGSLTLQGGSVVAKPVDVYAAFAAAVRAGSYPKVSASLYSPQHRHNPRPGRYYLKHVSFPGSHLPGMKNFGKIPASIVRDGPLVVIAGMPTGYRAPKAGAAVYRRALEIQADNPGTSIVEAAKAAQAETGNASFSAPAGYGVADPDETYRRANQIQLANPGHPWMAAYRAAQDEAEARTLAAKSGGVAGVPRDPNLALNLRARQLQSANLDLTYPAALDTARRQFDADRSRPLI